MFFSKLTVGTHVISDNLHRYKRIRIDAHTAHTVLLYLSTMYMHDCSHQVLPTCSQATSKECFEKSSLHTPCMQAVANKVVELSKNSQLLATSAEKKCLSYIGIDLAKQLIKFHGSDYRLILIRTEVVKAPPGHPLSITSSNMRCPSSSKDLRLSDSLAGCVIETAAVGS